MATQPSFDGSGCIFRELNLITKTIPAIGSFATNFVDVSCYNNFNIVFFNNNVPLDVVLEWSVNSRSATGFSFSETVSTLADIEMVDIGNFPVRARYLRVDVTGAPFTTFNLQALFHKTATDVQSGLQNVGSGIEVYRNPSDIKTLLSGTGVTIVDNGDDITISATGAGLSPYQGTTAISPVEVSTKAIVCGTGNINDGAFGLIGGTTGSTIAATSDRGIILGGFNNTIVGDFDQSIVGSCDSLVSECKRSGIYSAENCNIDTTPNSGLNSIWGGRDNLINNTISNTSFNQMLGCINATNTDSNQTLMLNATGTITGSGNCTMISSGTITNSINSHMIGGGSITHNDVFMCSDTSGGVLASTTTNHCMMRYSNGYTLFTASGAAPATGVTIGAGGGSWASVCDVNKKENLEELDHISTLQKVSRIPVYKYNYIGNSQEQYNFGPTAQDYHREFPSEEIEGEDGKMRPSKNPLVLESMDVVGVLMSSIKALDALLEAEIQTRERLEGRLEKSEARVAESEKRMEKSEKRLKEFEERLEKTEAGLKETLETRLKESEKKQVTKRRGTTTSKGLL